jgi:hypothetical protein
LSGITPAATDEASVRPPAIGNVNASVRVSVRDAGPLPGGTDMPRWRQSVSAGKRRVDRVNASEGAQRRRDVMLYERDVLVVGEAFRAALRMSGRRRAPTS